MCRYSEGLINERFDKFWPAAANAYAGVGGYVDPAVDPAVDPKLETALVSTL